MEILRNLMTKEGEEQLKIKMENMKGERVWLEVYSDVFLENVEKEVSLIGNIGAIKKDNK